MQKQKLVVLSGAGISAESGLKTFRDSDGLWEGFDIDEVATPRGWKKNPQKVLDFYNMRRKNVAEATPNAAHYGLASLEAFFDVQIITQNIDDLHERAGSSNVLHLHGEIFKMCSEKDRGHVCEIKQDILLGDLAPDGAQYRPDIVWFEEPVEKIPEAMHLVSQADIFVVVGTSLVVYPAAGLVDFAPPASSKYIIDKKIPYTIPIPNLVAIEKPASQGIQDLIALLTQQQQKTG